MKITIFKKTLNNDLIDEYIIDKYKDMNKCDCVEIGQEFFINLNLEQVPEGFCHWAWVDIHNNIN